MNIEENIKEIKRFLANENCKLIAVSKTKSVEEIKVAYDAGQRDFGENKVQELQEKVPQLPADIRWHMIGHLQTNKVKYITTFVHLIHSVDSLKLLREINKQGKKSGRVINCLLQLHIASEESKFGLSESGLYELLTSDEFQSLQNINVTGLMGMATFTDNTEQVRSEFRYLKNIFDKVSEAYTVPNTSWNEISMGMSDDYQIAVKEGSTMIRVGSKIFGARIYH